MVLELSNEDIVTRLLTSNDVIKPRKGKFYISNPAMDTLGDFLLEQPLEIKTPDFTKIESPKYRFIKL